MAGAGDDPKKRVGRKLTKRPRAPHRLPSSLVPERLKYGDDVHEDVTASPKGPGGASNLNQSIFTMIAAAGSKTDFHARFDESSDSEEVEGPDAVGHAKRASRGGKTQMDADIQATVALATNEATRTKGSEGRQHRSKLSEHKLLRSLPKLSLKSSKGPEASSGIASPPPREILSPTNTSPILAPRDAPMMSRMLEAQLDANDNVPDITHPSLEISKTRERVHSSPATLLATRLMEIFGFEKPEKVVAEYPCWLLQSVLLQGYMYITRKHICFYAYLPKKDNVIAKSGYLSKRGRQNSRYNRYWFTLKGDVLAYYSSPADLYFPSGNIDLRYGISASLSESKDKAKETKEFVVSTNSRTYHLKADSSASAKEWVKTLRKVIFRSHNDGDSVKISLPVENVIDIEENPVMDFAETFKIRVVESEDSFAIDEYFFSFFSFGKEAFDVLKTLVDDSTAARLSQDLLSPTSLVNEAGSSREPSPGPRKSLDLVTNSAQGAPTPVFRESIRATLLPRSPADSGLGSPRPSGEFPRSSRDLVRHSIDFSSPEYGRASFDRGRRSGSTSRISLNRRQSDKSPLVQKQGSSDSFVQSLEQGTESSAAVHSTTDTQESASQILNRSDVFKSPTIHRLRASPPVSREDLRGHSVDTARSRSPQAAVKALPPSGASMRAEAKSHQHSAQAPVKSSNNGASQLQQSNSSPSLQDLVKAGGFPLQRAAGFAGYLRNRSKRMSSLLASESMGYFEKVHGMWAGGRRHYGENEGIIPDDKMVDPEDEEASCGHGDRFRAHFALPESEKLQATYFGYLQRVLPLYGKVYISNRKFCFRSLLPGSRTKLVLPLKDIENVDKEKGFRMGYHGIVLVIRGHEEMFFEFNSADVRDDCAVTLLQNLESMKYLVESGLLAQQDKDLADAAKAEHEMLQEARKGEPLNRDLELPTHASASTPEEDGPPVLFDDPRASIINFKPTESLRITCLTIGSRGDVQPYIALCKGLIAEGHKPKIATHVEFEDWVRKHGIDFAPVDGDPAELMRICVENGMFTYSFLKEASVKFRSWIDSLLSSAWKACQNTDILIESPSAMAGVHIAEALGVPYFRAFTMPWTRTRAYPHAFAVPEHKIGGAYNYFSYVMFDNVFWKAISGQVNRWRKKELGLRSTNLDKMQPNKIPFLYNFSPRVVVPPIDYSDWVRVTGYWFLDEATNWTPPKELTDFIARARADGKKMVYIGFGSIVVSDPAALTKTVVDSVLKADVRCILSKGWSDRLGDPSAPKTEVPLPPEIHQIKSAPHDWLFKQIDAAVHHGGAGTTGASLRAGLPTIIKPFFGDQFFFGSRVEDLGVGICLKKVNVSIFARALWEAVHSERMIAKAKVLGEEIRMENGVDNAIQAIYRDLEYAKTLIKRRNSEAGNTGVDDDLGTIEESWTFIGDESDPELQARIKNWNRASSVSQIKAERLSRDLGQAGTKTVGAVERKPSGRVRYP